MALTITNINNSMFGNKLAIMADVAFDGSYPFGGEGLVPNKFGLTAIERMIVDTCKGYTVDYDITNEKLKVFTSAPPIIYEEAHTAVANTVTLDYPAAWIINVCTTGQNEALTGRGDTLADHECKLTSAIEDGVRTQITTYGATDAILVTYATQAWAELYALLVQEEAVTLATGDVNLANKMAAFGYCYDSTTGILLPVDVGDTTASGEVGIKFNVATAQLNLHSDEDGHTAVVTYLKMPESGTWLYNHWVTDEDPTKAGGDPYTLSFDYPLLMWGITGCATVTGGATQKIVDEAIVVAAGEANTHWGYRGSAPAATAFAAEQVWGVKSNVTITAGNYIKGHPWEIPGVVSLEVKNAADLSGLSAVKVMAIGY